ncbi:MAG: plasmid pRiA4b ORF-3 family protein [Actinomycetota bacterium]|nr:plasmid pRiA4b ORF-3 family protein [Actinomycetota bacterium]
MTRPLPGRVSGATPPIWRRLEVPSGIALERLHRVSQETFGWADCHMGVFLIRRGEYRVADRELGHHSAAATELAKVASIWTPPPMSTRRFDRDEVSKGPSRLARVLVRGQAR